MTTIGSGSALSVLSALSSSQHSQLQKSGKFEVTAPSVKDITSSNRAGKSVSSFGSARLESLPQGLHIINLVELQEQQQKFEAQDGEFRNLFEKVKERESQLEEKFAQISKGLAKTLKDTRQKEMERAQANATERYEAGKKTWQKVLDTWEGHAEGGGPTAKAQLKGVIEGIHKIMDELAAEYKQHISLYATDI